MENLYLFYGSEKLLIDEEVEKMKKKLVPEHLESVNFVVLEGKNVTKDQIVNAVTTVPMMSKRKLVLIKDAIFIESTRSKTPKNIDIDLLLKIIEDIPEYSYIVFTCLKPDKRKKIFKLIKSKGIEREFASPNLKQKTQWIQSRIKKYGKKMDYKTAYFLAQYTKDLYQTDEELKKLSVFTAGKGEIVQEDIESIFSKTMENNIFEMMDFIGMKKPEKAIEVLNDLIMRGEKGILILFMISKHIANLISVKAMSNLSFDEINKALKLHPFVLRKAIGQSKNFSLEELKKALKLCQTLDFDLKRGKTVEKTGLEILMTTISK